MDGFTLVILSKCVEDDSTLRSVGKVFDGSYTEIIC